MSKTYMIVSVPAAGRRIAPAVLALLVALALPAGAVFNDVTGVAGVDYVQYEVEEPPHLHPMRYMTGAAAAGDYDNDGCVDLFVTRYENTDILFRNNCDGTFDDVTASAGVGGTLQSNAAAWGDVDDDGDLDLYVNCHLESRYFLYINDGAGSFTEEAVARGVDLTSPDDHYGYSITFGDYDLDGYIDIYVAEWRHDAINPTLAASNSRLLHNRGAAEPGVFDDVTVAAGVELDAVDGGVKPGTFAFSPRFSDLDNDGYPDLAIASDFSESRLFWNNGNGTFSDGTVAAGVAEDENGMGSTIADYDGDGLLDWFVTSIYDTVENCPGEPTCDWGITGNRLYRNLGGRVFADATDTHGVRDGGWGWGSAFFDYDNDGDLDLIMTNGHVMPQLPPGPYQTALQVFADDPMRLWRNDGAGLWPEVASAEGIADLGQGGSGKGLLTFDYDNDGDLDVFVTNNTAGPVLFTNTHGNQNDWLRVDVRGDASNRYSIGARVEVQVVEGGPVQTREINSGSHFLGQSETIAHFGLGPGAPLLVHRVSVSWPVSGKVFDYFSIAKNTVFVAKEKKKFACGLLGLEPLGALLAAVAGARWWRRAARA